MNALAHLSDIVIPILIFFIVGYGFVSKVKVYETFLKGAKDGWRCITLNGTKLPIPKVNSKDS